MSRCLLHKTKLDAFKAWLDAAGIPHRPGKGTFQVLQVALPRKQWGVVYDRIDAPEHYTVTGPLERTVRRFLRNADRDTRSCTCHPDDNPPQPCPRKFALTDCKAAAASADCADLIAVADYLEFDGSMSEADAMRRASLLRRLANVQGASRG